EDEKNGRARDEADHLPLTKRNKRENAQAENCCNAGQPGDNKANPPSELIDSKILRQERGSRERNEVKLQREAETSCALPGFTEAMGKRRKKANHSPSQGRTGKDEIAMAIDRQLV